MPAQAGNHLELALDTVYRRRDQPAAMIHHWWVAWEEQRRLHFSRVASQGRNLMSSHFGA